MACWICYLLYSSSLSLLSNHCNFLKGSFGKDTDLLCFKYLFLKSIGYPVVPKYYYVPADFVEHEKRNPGSQKRFPSNCGRDGKLFLWGQALYVIAKLLGKWRKLGTFSPLVIKPLEVSMPLLTFVLALGIVHPVKRSWYVKVYKYVYFPVRST